MASRNACTPPTAVVHAFGHNRTGGPITPVGAEGVSRVAAGVITGAVGIEGLSRGCREAHFVELDPRVARAVLQPNLETCNMTPAASVHVMVRPTAQFVAVSTRVSRNCARSKRAPLSQWMQL